MSKEEGSWTYECEDCQELALIKGRCEEYRIKTIELKKKLKEANQLIDKLQQLNKANNVAAKEDLRKLERVANDQKAIIDNFRLMLKLGRIQ